MTRDINAIKARLAMLADRKPKNIPFVDWWAMRCGVTAFHSSPPETEFTRNAPADIAALIARVEQMEGAIGAALIELVNEDVGKATSILLSTTERSEPQP